MLPFNNTDSTPTECIHHALFLSNESRSQALDLWINLLCIALPYTLWASWFCTLAATTENQKTTLSARPFFGKIEKWFAACTVFLGLNTFLFLVNCLAIQAQKYCVGGPISDASYITQWVFQGLLGGGVLATAAICWVNCLMAVRGKEEVLQNWWVLKWEAYVLTSPFILIALGAVVLIKGPEACRQLKVLQKFRQWRDTKSPCPTLKGFKKWRQGLVKRKGNNSGAGVVSEPGIDLEQGQSLASQGGKAKLSKSAAAPPPYAHKDPLN